ncbi:RraA family protein [Alkalihalobacillus oceani]|uniref:RraA family protein n=1 Tax=Halalkalibacter oceani TaxID=1653776 RepID=UPI00203DC04A|nr:RraA family protein [Halalkalibacter oceani]MCM3760272.1 RraA family protein [Halalkalibacter oceani]
MKGTIGFGYNEKVKRTPPARLKQLEGVASSTITDAQRRTGTMHPRIKPIAAGSRLVGNALTVELPPGDNFMLYVALKLAEPGDILVVTTQGNQTKAVWGELMTQSAQALRLGGIVIDGLIRDKTANQERDLPIFCQGAVPVSVEKNGPGFVNGEISCGDVTVRPGDVIVGDDDGIVVIKQENVAAVIEQLGAIEKREEQRVAEIAAGQVLPAWVENKMKEVDLVTENRVLE